MKRTIAALLCLVIFACLISGCAGNPEKPKKEEVLPRLIYVMEKNERYTRQEIYFKNYETNRRVYGQEIIPAGLAEGEKVPLIIYVHGGSGEVETMVPEAKQLMGDKIAAFIFECCGTNRVNPQSDGKDIFSAHYTSRISDLEAALAYVKTLPYVDLSRIYLYGRSAGGVAVMIDAVHHNDDIAGIVLESSGLAPKTESMLAVDETSKGVVEKYLCQGNWEEFVLGYRGDVLVVCTENDEEGAYPNGEYSAAVYARRDVGSSRFVGCPEGQHTFNCFTAEGKQMTLDAIRDLVYGTNGQDKQ